MCYFSGICGEPCLPCDGGKRCLVQLCTHKKCKSKCEDLCKSGCKEKCEVSCPHLGPCNKKCGHSSSCSGRRDELSCEELCDKLLHCGHKCIGYCGENCPDTCSGCDTSVIHDPTDR